MTGADRAAALAFLGVAGLRSFAANCAEPRLKPWLRALLAETAPKANRFDCAECGAGVAVDEDGCCRTCGAEASIVEEATA